MVNLQNIGPPVSMNMPRGSSSQLQADKFDLESKLDVRSDNKPDTKAPDIKAKAFEKTKNPGQRHKGEAATSKFMDSMESELGVTPERILVAMAAMKPRDMAEPASVSSESFVNNLNLDQTVRPKAFQLYNQLLVDKGILAPLEPGSLIAQMNVVPMSQSQGSASTEGLMAGLSPKAQFTTSQAFTPKMEIKPSGIFTPNMEIKPSGEFKPKAEFMPSGMFNPNAEIAPSGEFKPNAEIAPSGEFKPDAEFIPSGEFNPNAEFTPSGEFKPNAEFIPSGEFNPNAEFTPSGEFNPNAEFIPSGELNPNAEFNLNDDGLSLSDTANVTATDTDAYTDADADLSDSERVGNSYSSKELSSGREPNSLKPKAKAKGQVNTELSDASVPLTSLGRRQKLNASIDKMNDSFFMNAEAQKKAAQQTASEGMQKTVLPFDRPVGQQQNLVDDVQAWQQREALAVPTQSMAKPIMQSNSFGNSKAGDFDSETDSADLEKSMLSKEDQDFQNQVYGRLNSEWEANKLPAVKADSSIVASQMNNVDKVKNMQNLIENAKILTQNGGGEMKMQLSPEGLGDMQLKVIVANGKVDLELKTQNHDVKKLMESTINELKSSLAQHSLSVDKIKVDVGAQDSTSSGDSFAKQFQMNDNREQARQFLGQFRENNFSQRNNMFDVPGFKTYQSQRGEDLEPVTNRPVRPRAMEANKGQGLNLVA